MKKKVQIIIFMIIALNKIKIIKSSEILGKENFNKIENGEGIVVSSLSDSYIKRHNDFIIGNKKLIEIFELNKLNKDNIYIYTKNFTLNKIIIIINSLFKEIKPLVFLLGERNKKGIDSFKKIAIFSDRDSDRENYTLDIPHFSNRGWPVIKNFFTSFFENNLRQTFTNDILISIENINKCIIENLQKPIYYKIFKDNMEGIYQSVGGSPFNKKCIRGKKRAHPDKNFFDGPLIGKKDNFSSCIEKRVFDKKGEEPKKGHLKIFDENNFSQNQGDSPYRGDLPYQDDFPSNNQGNFNGLEEEWPLQNQDNKDFFDELNEGSNNISNKQCSICKIYCICGEDNRKEQISFFWFSQEDLLNPE